MKYPGNFHEDVDRSRPARFAPPLHANANLARPVGVGDHVARAGVRAQNIFEGHLIVVRHQTKRGPVKEGIVEKPIHLHALRVPRDSIYVKRVVGQAMPPHGLFVCHDVSDGEYALGQVGVRDALSRPTVSSNLRTATYYLRRVRPLHANCDGCAFDARMTRAYDAMVRAKDWLADVGAPVDRRGQ